MSSLKSMVALLLWHVGAVRMVGILRRFLRGPRLIVLCYHRIDNNPDLPAISASPVEFESQLAWFSRRFEMLSMDAVTRYLKENGKLKQDSIALTFDDGYSDNFNTVLPMLKSRKIPAIFFITTGPLLRRMPYWYDALCTYLKGWNQNALPESIMRLLPQEIAEALEQVRQHPSKFNLNKALVACKALRVESRETLSQSLQQNQKPGGPVSVCETMTLQEAMDCMRGGVEMGGHTRSHPSLARIPEEECRQEIIDGLQELRGAGFTVKYFAYPFGEAEDVGGPQGLPYKILKILSERVADGSNEKNLTITKVELAFTTEERAMRSDENPLLIPRKVITPQSLSQIALKLEILAWQK